MTAHGVFVLPPVTQPILLCHTGIVDQVNSDFSTISQKVVQENRACDSEPVLIETPTIFAGTTLPTSTQPPALLPLVRSSRRPQQQPQPVQGAVRKARYRHHAPVDMGIVPDSSPVLHPTFA